MIFEIEINNKPVKVKRGETILEVLNRCGIHVPTLCSMKGYTPTGMCRLCVVEVEGRDNLIPSCSFKVEEWMKIKTHSPKVVQARKTIIELLLANHPDDCLFCERNGNCELQKHAGDLHVRDRRIKGEKPGFFVDKSSASIVYEASKCILCGRCIRVCNEQIGVSTLDFAFRGIQTSVKPAMDVALSFSNCVQCGQCTMACPTAALRERISFSELQVFFHDPNKEIMAVYSPAVAITLADEFGIKPGRDLNGILNAVLRKIGFNAVFDNSFAADVALMEEVYSLYEKISDGNNGFLLSSCCPSWTKYLEQSVYQQYVDNLSTAKSAQQTMGALLKTYYADMKGQKPENMFVVSIVPCTSRKMEAKRPELTSKGISDVDAVITTRELIRMIRMYGIDMANIEPENADHFYSATSTNGKLINVSGGKAESIMRGLYYLICGTDMPDVKISALRGSKSIKETTIQMGKYKIGVAVVNGLIHAPQVLDSLLDGRTDLHYIEVMACEGGCIAGGGQPIQGIDDAIKARTKCIYDLDEKDIVRSAYQSPLIDQIYNDYLGKPYDPKNYALLHAWFSKKEILF